MNKSIKAELKAHVMELIADGVINQDNAEDAHYHAFNEDYYPCYWRAEQWLKKHGVSERDATNYILEQDLQEYDERTLTTDDLNAGKVVNLVAYYAGMELNFEKMLKGE